MISSSLSRLSGLSVVLFVAFFSTCSAFCQQDPAPSLTPGRVATTSTDLGQVSPSVALDDLQIVLERSPEQQQALEILLVRQSQEGDPLFHAWLTPGEFGESFGLAAEDLVTVREWLQEQGFSVGDVRANEMVIDFSGTVGQVERAFKVEIHRYRAADGSMQMEAAQEQQIPAKLKKSVVGFTGLNGRSNHIDCNSVPEPVRQALEQNSNQLNAAQGYANPNPCETSPAGTVHPDVSGTLTLLASFTGSSGAAPGSSPYYGNLMQASDGNFYGTAEVGGTGYGTVFKITPGGTYTLLHSFSTAATDGVYPKAGLIQATDGNFYGTTWQGGLNGVGTVFRITPAGAFTVLHSFSTSALDGQSPYAGLVQGTDGNFYGTTLSGGIGTHGTLFKMLAVSPYTVTLLHSFANSTTDGGSPYGTVIQSTDGNFYGTTFNGGTTGYGTVYKILAAAPYTETLMHSFSVATSDGETPWVALVQGTDGNFYGTTETAGGSGRYGTVFKILAASPYTLTLLHTFTGGTTDGQYPYAGLVLGTDGNFYGTTEAGGSSTNGGTVYEVSSSGTYTMLHAFSGGSTDGEYPYGGLVQGIDGNFYGTTFNGGTNSYGTIYKLTVSPTQNAPVQLSASSTTVGLGQSFTMSYSAVNTDTGTLPGTLNQCFESNTAGDTTYWHGVVDATATTATQSVTTTAAGTFSYALTCGGVESNLVTITVKLTPTLTMTTPTAASPVTQTLGSLAAFNVTSTLSWTGSTAPTAADVVFTSTAGGTFGTATCGATSPATCTSSFTPTASDAAGSYSFSVAFTGDGSFSSTSSSTIANDYVISKQTPVLTMTTPTAGSPVTQTVGSLAAFNVTSTLTWTGSTLPTAADVVFTSTAAGTFGTATCGATSPATCTAAFTPTATDVPGSYGFSVAFSGDSNYKSTTASSISNDYIIILSTPIVSVTPLTSPYSSTAEVTVTATESGAAGTASGSVVTFGTAGSVGGSFSPTTCTISSGSCTTLYIPSGTLAVGTYANDITASFTTSGNYLAASAATSLTITNSFGFSLLASFPAATTIASGNTPYSGNLIQANDGNFYGATEGGGANSYGTIFQITQDGDYSLLHSFAAAEGTSPNFSLVQGTDGNFYGTTEAGGANGYGTVFKMSPVSPYALTVLYSFSATLDPNAGLVQGTDGNFYGTTRGLGASLPGAVFKISPVAPYNFTLMHSFPTNGGAVSALVQGTDGNFYGTTLTTAFKISPTSPYTLTTLHSFSGTDGTAPNTLVQGTDGNLYGTAQSGGASGDQGTVFKLSTISPYNFTLLHSFVTTGTDGRNIQAGLVEGSDGNFYGTAIWGGANSYGTAFEITSSGNFVMLHAFSSDPTDGEYPFAGMIQGTDGNFYGMTAGGGANGYGAIYALTASPAELAPVQLNASATSLTIGQSFTLSYSVLNADTGASAGTLNQCFESNTAGDTTYWNSVVDVTSTTATQSVTPVVEGTFNYVLTCGGMESSVVTITINAPPSALNLVAATPGSASAGVASTVLTATMTPAISGVTVTFTDFTTGATATATTNASGVAATTVTGTTAGPNVYSASIPANFSYAAASSNSVGVYYAGLLLTSDLTHNFSSNPGTYDGSPICNGSNGTNGSTCTSGYGIVVTNFTNATQVVQLSLSNSGSLNAAFSSATNCPAGGLAAGKTCNIVFYYLPPYGDGCSLSTTCVIPAGQSGPQGTYESAGWTLSAGSTIFGAATGGVVTFPTTLEGKALLAVGNMLTVTPSSLTFGPQAPGAVSAVQNVTVKNTGAASIAVTYAISNSKFTSNNGCAASLAAGVSCQIQITYSDASAASDTGNLTITPASGSAVTVALTGSTVNNSGLSLSTIAHNFGSVTDGSSATFGLGVKNNSATTATISFSNTAGSGFNVVNGCGATLAAGASCNYDFTFAPTAAGASVDTLVITSSVPILPGGTTSSPYTDTVTVTGTGVAGGSFTATSVAHNFGSVAVGSSATTYGVKLANNTATSITLTLGGGTFASNAAADGYSVVTNCGATLAANANCEVEFNYTPTGAGTTQVMYPIAATNSSGSVPLMSGGASYSGITLTGTGQ